MGKTIDIDIGIGIATRIGGNSVKMDEKVRERLKEVEALLPPDIWLLSLPSFGIDFLVKVAASADQRDRHHGQFQVRCRAQRIAGKYTEAAAVGRDLIAQGNSHREIGDARLMYEFVKHFTLSSRP